jgi:hypothetical protein
MKGSEASGLGGYLENVFDRFTSAFLTTDANLLMHWQLCSLFSAKGNGEMQEHKLMDEGCLFQELLKSVP